MKIVTICAATMNTLIVLVCSVLAIANCKDDSVIIIGPKYIQPRQPYTVAMINPFRTEVMMNLTLACDGTASRQTKTLKKESCGRYFLDVPDGIDIKSECAFLADNIGGKIMVKHYVEVRVATKTLSIFIITDKPIYKPGDIVRFRVIVLDMATKPVNHINSIQIDLEDSEKKSQKQWTRAVLNKGIFATEYRLSSTLALGTWNITATVNDGTIPNVQFQLFEVREYVMPKFFIKVTLLRVPLISDKEISLMVEANYTFGRPVRGNILVQLITDDLLNTVADIDEKSFDGNATFRLKLKKELTILDDEDYAMVKAKICLKEQFSDFKLNVTKEIPVFVYPYKITFIGPVKYYRPGVPYHCKLSVKDHNGVPVKDKFIIAKTDTGKKQSATLDSQGIASLDLPMPDTTSSVDISVDFENREYNNVARIEGKKDAPTQHLQISLHKRNIRRSTVSFIVKSNDKFSRLYYFVTSRGNILLARYEQCLNKMKYTINLELTVEMTVQSKLLVYTLNSGQLIMDHFELAYFANGFEFSLQNHTVQPDQNVKINVKAAEDSYVAFQAIDQGALLLGHEVFGITMADVLEDLDAYTPKQNSLNLDPIDHFGLFLKSASSVQDRSARKKRSIHRTKRQMGVKSIFLRTDFPESWFWTSYTMKNHMFLAISGVIPHTITSWYVTGFALSPTRGLGLINEPAKLTVSKPFYMIANLPYSIKRNEIARIQVTLFNFKSTEMTVDVTLFNKANEIEFVDRKSNDTKRRKKAVVVSPYASASISFLIKAKKLGVIAIKIEAASQSTTDGLERMLHVTPESRLFKKSEAEFVNLHSHDKQEFDIHLTIPEVVDNDSVKILVVVDAPSLGTVAQNLNNLFAIPTGAGSLNLLTFIPNVVVLDYIKETCKNKSVTEENAISYLSSGYKNQLKYRHSNGAFGQWEPPEKEPSVFLTALVANAFSTATKHIEIDQTVITDAFSWIKGKQKSNGCFEEDGEKIYEPMQNSSSSFALTAFIVAAIKENENIATQFSELVEKATNCLADNFYSLTNTHDIALATYALSLTGHANREAYLSILIQDSHNENNERYWKEDLKVEIAGYALLSYLAQNMYHEAIPIMKWLNKQRYSTGAFAGVHSTFVALKALGKMATYLNKRHHDYTVHVRYDDHHQSFGVVHSDSLVPIYHEIPGDIRVIDFEVVGTGFGLLQVTYEYFLNIQASIARPAFNLDVNVLDTSTSEIQYLHVCLSYIDREVYTTSGLTLVEVYLPSGLVVHENAVKDQSRRIKRTERAFHNTAMFVYYNEVSTNQECFEVTAHRKYQIALHRPAYVVVYDTNDMDKYAVKSYEGKVLQPCQICDRDDCRSMNC